MSDKFAIGALEKMLVNLRDRSRLVLESVKTNKGMTLDVVRLAMEAETASVVLLAEFCGHEMPTLARNGGAST